MTPKSCLLGQLCLTIDEWSAWGTWAGSLGVALTFIATIVALQRERRIRRSDQNKILAEKIRWHAERLSAWMESQDFSPGLKSVVINNASESVAYEMLILLVPLGELRRECQGALSENERSRLKAYDAVPPGTWKIGILPPNRSSGNGRLGIELHFTDRAGLHWTRLSNGKLLQQRAAWVEKLRNGGHLEFENLGISNR